MSKQPPKYDSIPDLRDGESRECEPEVVKFSLNGGQGPHLRFVLKGKRGRGGPRQEPDVALERLKGHDALGAERWEPYDDDDLEHALGHFYLALRAKPGADDKAAP